ncbi:MULTISPECIES: hypothetical protein [Cryobacterium]|uniref:hypothetical protein n=1 Tax=Cryobacterium TaxID=69578 RepID=UPI000CD3EA19|nr:MULTISPECIES: hypothetical protein [Cryobacterium]POH66094.1 hypothetical protein C3B60_09735 [Cryobacterium zongtaii]TFC46761.1 hypothetical protein E3O57_05875 [Cryobacterium sp. TMN-39-2]
MDAVALNEALIESIRGKGALTIPEVAGELAVLGVAVEGDRALFQSENVVVWIDLSGEAVAALQRLVADERSEVTTAMPATYAMEGALLEYPLVTGSGIKRGYKTPHWLPLEIAVRP